MSVNQKAMNISNVYTLRFSVIYWLATLLVHVDDETDLACVIDDFQYDCDEIANAFGWQVNNHQELFKRIICEQTTGFLARVERPIIKKIGYSWSEYQSTWVYAETLDELLAQAKKAFHLTEE